VTLGDEPIVDGNPYSSLRACGDAVLGKLATDVYVTGSARVARPTVAWETSVEVIGSESRAVRSSLQATGPRRWEWSRLAGWTLCDPTPTTEVPILYEAAYGGAYRDPRSSDPDALCIYEPNPCGRGFVDESSLDRQTPVVAPQWQSKTHPVTEMNRDVPLAGFGPVPRSFGGRLRHAGTYDDAWLERTQAEAARGLPPDYPADFDVRFFQCAPVELTSREYLRGDERLVLSGLVADHPRFETRLPGGAVKASVYFGNGPWRDYTVPLDTVHIDLDAKRVHLVWRLLASHHVDLRAAVFTLEEAG
jgi:hypothetical protein